MAKLQDMFTQARRAQSGGGMGFLGKSKAETKARAAALVVELPEVTAGSAEAALKAGADGLLYHWDGKDTTSFETLKQEIEAAKAKQENTATGLHVTGGWDKLDQERLKQLVEAGVQYIILPFNAPARLLALETKDLEKVVTVPMKTDEIYPLYIHNLTAVDGIAAVLLDFDLKSKLASMTIEEVLDYRAVREAVRFPAFLHVENSLNEADAYTLSTLGVQALILSASEIDESTKGHVKHVRELLEKIHEDNKEKNKDTPSLPSQNRK